MRVIVSSEGVASPSIVTFYVVPKATEVPSFQVNVPVRYQYGNQLIASTVVSLQNGTTSTVYADSSIYSDRYILTSDSAVRVTVSVAGAASPAQVIFYLTPKITPTPTAVPVSEVPVTVRYMNGSSLVASYQEMCATNAVTTIYANPAVYEGSYELIGDGWSNVSVDARGTATPPYVTFNLTPVKPVTPVPSFPVPVPVEYRYGDQLINSSVVMLESGTTTVVQTDSSKFAPDYVLAGSDRVSVTVSSEGYADPNPIIFFVVPSVEPITPEPVPPYGPTVVPPSGNRNTTLSYQEYSWSANYDVYQGPGEFYYRQGNAKFGGGKARIYGTDGDWLLIGYGASNGDYHIGYIHNYKLPSKAKNVRPVTYAWLPATTKSSVTVTTDPVSNMKKLETLPKGTQVYFLAWASSKHRYALIEYESPSYNQTVRAFVKGG